ncbi:MAG: hypothetical protein SGILL_005760 [Bacillariaceae sp.]
MPISTRSNDGSWKPVVNGSPKKKVDVEVSASIDTANPYHPLASNSAEKKKKSGGFLAGWLVNKVTGGGDTEAKKSPEVLVKTPTTSPSYAEVVKSPPRTSTASMGGLYVPDLNLNPVNGAGLQAPGKPAALREASDVPPESSAGNSEPTKPVNVGGLQAPGKPAALGEASNVPPESSAGNSGPTTQTKGASSLKKGSKSPLIGKNKAESEKIGLVTVVNATRNTVALSSSTLTAASGLHQIPLFGSLGDPMAQQQDFIKKNAKDSGPKATAKATANSSGEAASLLKSTEAPTSVPKTSAASSGEAASLLKSTEAPTSVPVCFAFRHYVHSYKIAQQNEKLLLRMTQ